MKITLLSKCYTGTYSDIESIDLIHRRLTLNKKFLFLNADTFNSGLFNDNVHKSLRELNLKENDYILVANRTPSNYRGTTSLAFLQAIQWTAVFDLFDPKTKEDGLYYILNKTSDSPPYTKMELGDFKDNEERPTYDRTWITRNQTMHESSWIHNSSDCLRQAMWMYHKRSRKGRIHCVFLVLSDENLKSMADIILTCVKIIGAYANKCITILSEKKENGDALTKVMDPDVRKDLKEPCCVFDFPLQFLRDSIEEMLGDVAYEDADAATDLPYWNGKQKAISSRRIKSLTDLEVYLPRPKLSSSLKEVKNARDNFYKGEVIKQINLDNRDDIERTLANDLTKRINQSLEYWNKASPEDTTCVKVVSLRYESGSGATTLGRRVLWDKKNSVRCALVKSISDNTYHQIQELQNFGYETIDHDRQLIPPVLILVDNEREHDFDNLYDKLAEKNVKCVLVKTIPIEKKGDDDCLNLGTLDAAEIQRVKKILSSLEDKDDKEKYAAVKKVEDEKRFIWLGLQLFGQDYKDIRKRLSEHIKNIIFHNVTDHLKDVYKMILRFCCLLEYYSKGKFIYPHPCIADVLSLHEDVKLDNVNQIQKIHDKFGGLLLDEDSEGYRGWRPAHFLVAELVHEEMDFVETAKLLVTTMNSGNAYAKTYLIDKTVNVFLNREKTSESPLQNFSEADIFLDGNTVENEFDSLKVQKKYSALVMAALDDSFPSNVINVLDLLVTLVENVHTTQHKARTWQQIARVFAYEIGTMKKNEEERDAYKESIKPLVERINEELRLPDQSLNCSATNGFAMAHQVIDHAINLQKDFVNHLVTKATIFKVELRNLYERAKDIGSRNEESKDVMVEAITTTKKGIQAHDNALEKDPKGYLHAMVGKIETIIALLEIFKTHCCFSQSDVGPDESFKNYITFGDHPDALKEILTEDDLNYFHGLATKAIQYINEFFEELKFRKKQYRKHNRQALINAKIRAMAIRKKFYQVTQRNRRFVDFGGGDKDISNNNNEAIVVSGCEEDIVQDLLYDCEETAFSTWKKIKSNNISRIYSLMNVAISKGPVSKESMLIFARAALEENVTVDELLKHVQLWSKCFPDSIWCHLFNYMIHFPVPSGALKSNVQIVNKSAKFCKTRGPRIRERSRKSGAEYLLGKGTGLNVILSSHKVSQDSVDDKSDFWRSLKLYEKLERLKGEKVLDKKGVLTYKGIEITFDDDRYPKESRDELWFCLGFTLNGPYAYDPIDEDTYRRMEADHKKNGALSQQSHIEVKNVCQRNKPGSASTRPTFEKKTSQTSDHRKKKSNGKDMKSTSENQIRQFPEESKHMTQCATEDTEWKSNPKLEIRSRAQEGHQLTFKPKWIDADGKVHHGALVKRAKKSSICQRHQQNTTIDPKSCTFAHPWLEDYVQQTVCYHCTKADQWACVGKGDKHSHFIYELGNYRNKSGEIWQKDEASSPVPNC